MGKDIKIILHYVKLWRGYFNKPTLKTNNLPINENGFVNSSSVNDYIKVYNSLEAL